MSVNEYERLVKKITKSIKWGRHKKCTYPNCALVDLFSIIFMSRSRLADTNERKSTAACKELAVECLLLVHDYQKYKP